MIKFLLAMLLVFSGLPAGAQPADEKRAALEAQQKQAAAEAEKLKQAAAAEAETLSTLQSRLVKASQEERRLAEQSATLLARTRSLEAERIKLKTALDTKRQDLATLLVALGRLARLPPEVGLLRDGNTKDALNTALLLEATLPEIKAEAGALATELKKLDAVEQELTAEQTKLAAARAAQDKEQAAIETLIKTRQQKLKLTTQQQQEIGARLARLRAEAASMDDLIRRVSTPKAPDKPPTIVALRGGFLQPASGKVVRGFGESDETGVKNQGLTINAPVGGRIVAPASGRVMFAGPFKGYGQIVILEHEADMHSFISGFSRIDANVGQRLDQGEPLGLAGSENPATVYFELRRNGDPIDPRRRS